MGVRKIKRSKLELVQKKYGMSIFLILFTCMTLILYHAGQVSHMTWGHCYLFKLG